MLGLLNVYHKTNFPSFNIRPENRKNQNLVFWVLKLCIQGGFMIHIFESTCFHSNQVNYNEYLQFFLVKNRATKMLKRIKDLSYNERLKTLEVDILESRRKRGDLITTFELINGLDSATFIKGLNIDINLHNKGLRRHKSKIKRKLVKNCPARYYFLLNRVAPLWNTLP